MAFFYKKGITNCSLVVRLCAWQDISAFSNCLDLTKINGANSGIILLSFKCLMTLLEHALWLSAQCSIHTKLSKKDAIDSPV